MGSLKVFVFIVATLMVISYVSASFSDGCPPKNKVSDRKPACFSDADCQKFGKVCCPNQFNTKSCVDRAHWLSRTDNTRSNYKEFTGIGGGGVYCAGVKCRPYEVCKVDPITKRERCQKP